MENFSTRRIAKSGVIAALYVVLTVALSALSYGSIQFRVAEALMLLCLFSMDYVVALTVGCFAANIFSTVGAIDTVVGTLATLLAGLCIYLLRNKLNYFTASLFPVIFNAVFVGFELKLVFGLPLGLSMLEVGIGEIVCVTIVGGILLKALSKNKGFMSMITNEREKQFS
jgi:uncharacterized membrane protein